MPLKKKPYAPFDKAACAQIEKAIEEAEKQTSGEIRVHVSEVCADNVMDSAVMAFEDLGMTNTKLRNGVLFFFATEKRKFAVLGDKGINDIVGQGFWDDIVAKIKEGFASGDPIGALCQSIAKCGDKLRAYFPPQPDDENELPNEVSFSHDKVKEQDTQA